MGDFLAKISSYNIFNCLLPGILFALIATNISFYYSFIQSDLLIGAFTYYFIGLMISRVGSLIIEPILKKVRILKFAPYSDFVSASEKDPKIEVLSETNNTYRTLCALMLALAVFKLYEFGEYHYSWLYDNDVWIFIGATSLLFLISYIKQSSYISMRVHVKTQHEHN